MPLGVVRRTKYQEIEPLKTLRRTNAHLNVPPILVAPAREKRRSFKSTEVRGKRKPICVLYLCGGTDPVRSAVSSFFVFIPLLEHQDGNLQK